MSRRNRWAERLAEECQRAGIRVRRTKAGWIAYGTDGRTTVGWHMTASDRRAEQNTVVALRHIGVNVRKTS